MTQNAKQYTIAVIPRRRHWQGSDPVGTAALEKATEGVATFEYEPFDLGAERYLREAEARWNTLCGQLQFHPRFRKTQCRRWEA